MKYIFNIINCLCVVLMAYLFVDMAYKKFVPRITVPAQIQEQGKSVQISPASQRLPRVNPFAHQVIVSRNLFKVATDGQGAKNSKLTDKDAEKLEPTTLSLILHGTVVGQGDAYAVIEDQKIRQQALYNVGDKVQGAEIREILRHKVILLFQGKRQVLIMEDKPSNVPKVAAAVPGIFPDFAPAVLPDSIKNLDPETIPQFASDLMRQIKFRQHMKDGQPDGLMVYGIRPTSIFRKVGLRNGDIVQQVNGTPVMTEADAISLLGEVIHAEQAKLTLLRRGQVEEVIYNMADGLQGAGE